MSVFVLPEHRYPPGCSMLVSFIFLHMVCKPGIVCLQVKLVNTLANLGFDSKSTKCRDDNLAIVELNAE